MTCLLPQPKFEYLNFRFCCCQVLFAASCARTRKCALPTLAVDAAWVAAFKCCQFRKNIARLAQVLLLARSVSMAVEPRTATMLRRWAMLLLWLGLGTAQSTSSATDTLLVFLPDVDAKVHSTTAMNTVPLPSMTAADFRRTQLIVESLQEEYRQDVSHRLGAVVISPVRCCDYSSGYRLLCPSCTFPDLTNFIVFLLGRSPSCRLTFDE